MVQMLIIVSGAKIAFLANQNNNVLPDDSQVITYFFPYTLVSTWPTLDVENQNLLFILQKTHTSIMIIMDTNQ